MRQPAIGRFGFRVRTRMGFVVDVALPGRDEMDAERKLRQIYRECDVIARIPSSALQRDTAPAESRSAPPR